MNTEASLITVRRLLSSLETLLAQEATLISDQNWDRLADVQVRASEISERLCEMVARYEAGSDLPLDVQVQAHTLLARQREKVAWLSSEMARVREELQSLRSSQGRLARWVPVYGQKHEQPAMLAFTGQA